MRGSSAKLRPEVRADRVRTRRLAVPWLALLLLCAPVSAAFAQQQDAAGTEGGTGPPRPGVEEIMVIGEVLESSTQSESEAITTFDQAELDTLGITNIETLALNTPSLHVGQVGQQAVITLRGVGLENLTSVGEGGVGFQVDGVHLGRPSASNAIFFDLERADVHRGPMGTRGGRQTNGGRIELWSKRPDEDLDASAELTLGNYDHREIRAILNVPIWEDKLLSRASVIYREHLGYQDFATSGVDTNDPGDADDFAGRGQLRSLWLDQTLEVRAIGIHSTQKGNGPAVKLLGPPPSTIAGVVLDPATGNPIPPQNQFRAGFIPVACPEPPALYFRPEVCNTGDPRETFADEKPFRDNEQNGITGLITWDLPFFADTPVSDLQLGFVGSWQQNIEDGGLDFDGTNISDQYFDQRRNAKQHSFEAYLERLDVGMWDFRAGVYFYQENIESTLCFDNAGLGRVGDIGYDADIDTTSFATYGEFGVRLREDFRVFGGLRWTDEKKTADEEIRTNFGPVRAGSQTRVTSNNQPAGMIPPLVVPNGTCGRRYDDKVGAPPGNLFAENLEFDNREGNFQGVTPMGGFEWQVTDDSSLGFSITRGFKAGGFPIVVTDSVSANTVQKYDSEFVMEYEATSKNELFDGRLRLNVTGFWMEYDPFQICQFNGPRFFCRSDGSSTIRGVEIEWRANPIEALTLNGHFNFLDSRINDFQIQDPTVRECTGFATTCPSIITPPQPNQTGAPQIDVSGNKQPKAPSYAGSFGIQYEFDLEALGFLTPRVQTQFQGKTFYRVFNRDEFSNDDYMKFDAKLTWRSESERYTVDFFVVNLTDVDVLNSVFVGSNITGGQVLGQYQPPRTYGVQLSINYVSDWLEDLF